MSRRRKRKPIASTERSSSTPWWRSTFAVAFAGAALLWMAFSPLQWTWLAWIAPVFWLYLVRSEELNGRPYVAIWLASTVHWLVMLYGVTLAHPLNHIGWVALCLYLAAYLPGFVALTRIAVHRFQISVVLAAPVVWTGLELLRGYLFTGFSFGNLAHTQVEWTQFIQVADLFGAYAVSFVVMLGAACLARMVPFHHESRVVWPLVPMIVVLTATLGYGHWRLKTAPSNSKANGTGVAANSIASSAIKVALIQRVIDTKFETDTERNRQAFDEYWQSTLDVRQEHPDLDLIIWPESVFSENNPEVQFDPDFFLPDDVAWTRQEVIDNLRSRQDAFRTKVQNVAAGVNRIWRNGTFETLDIRLLVGTETLRYRSDRLHVHNSALLINPDGEIVDRYYKMHPVMFGEYIPFASWFPIIYRMTPMSVGITPGTSPKAFQVAGTTLAPNICFESSVPNLIRHQVVELSQRGTPPDVLVNVTHDGWFFGSSILEHQFAATVFRAVELRRPILVAANAGISCWVDGSGQVRARGPRRGPTVIIANVQRDGRKSGYTLWGDLPVASCLLACLVLLASEVRIWATKIAIPVASWE